MCWFTSRWWQRDCGLSLRQRPFFYWLERLHRVESSAALFHIPFALLSLFHCRWVTNNYFDFSAHYKSAALRSTLLVAARVLLSLSSFAKPNWTVLAHRFLVSCWLRIFFFPTLFFILYHDWYSFVCNSHTLDLFYILFAPRESVRFLAIDFKQPLQQLPQDRYSFCFLFYLHSHFFLLFSGYPREIFDLPGQLFASIDIGHRLADTSKYMYGTSSRLVCV